MHRTVVHLTSADPGKVHSVLQNITNLYGTLGSETQIELVVHGPAIRVAAAPPSERLAALLEDGLSVCACRNSMASQELAEADLAEGVTTVPSGVAHLVVRQAEGWSYLRP